MNILSLFDGISCGMVALEKSGIKVDKYYASEIDETAINISRNNYPSIIQLGDICEIDEVVLNTLDKIDLILAGSPCQNLSRGGNGKGLEGKESKLFFEFVRILNWIKEKNNSKVLFLLENVEMKKIWKDEMSKCLGVNPLLINSKLMTAQNRPRLYWTNIKGVTIPDDKNIYLKDILLPCNINSLIKHDGILVDITFNKNELNLINVINGEVRVSQATKLGYIVAEDGDGVNLSFPTSKTRRGRVVKQKSSTLDRQCNVCVYYDGILRKLNIIELERLQTLPDNYTEIENTSKRKAAIGNGWSVDIIANILNNIK